MIIMFTLFGLCLGSFVNALVWRLRHKRDWVRERSECTHCHHVLAPEDLVPVLSWLWLRGKCRYCHKPIQDSPLTEMGLAGLFAVSYMAWPYSLAGVAGSTLFVLWLLLLVLFMALIVFDFKWYILPDTLTLGLIPMAVLFVILRQLVAPSSTLTTTGGLLAFGLFFVLYQVSKGKWIGGGDVKLVVSLGLLVGSVGAAAALLFVSSLLGTLYALPQMLKTRKTRGVLLPYGPFLILAAIAVVLWYPALLRMYMGILL